MSARLPPNPVPCFNPQSLAGSGSAGRMRATCLGLTLAPWLASTRGTIITVEHECGDLASCKFLNDGECDDGGATSKYFECPRFSDATDCKTQCASLGALPPPPPSCELSQWATSADASSTFSADFSAEQATGTPSHPATCTFGRTGSWAPATLGRSDEWLAVYFDQPVYISALLVYEHANPPNASGFVKRVDLWVEPSLAEVGTPTDPPTAGSWELGAWDLESDSTPCGGMLTLHADTAATPLAGKRVRGVRIHTRTDYGPAGAREYIPTEP